MKFSIIHPSRGRPLLANQVIQRTVAAASGKHEIEYILCFDQSDPLIEAYRGINHPHLVKHESTKESCGGAPKFNEGAALATGELLMIGTDHIKYPAKWDELLYETVKDIIDTPFALHVNENDGRVHYWSIFPIFSRKYYEIDGYALYPGYHHYYSDVEFYDVAMMRGMMIPAKHITIDYDHYTTGRVPKDSVYVSTELNLPHDAAVYARRKQSGFKEALCK